MSGRGQGRRNPTHIFGEKGLLLLGVLGLLGLLHLQALNEGRCLWAGRVEERDKVRDQSQPPRTPAKAGGWPSQAGAVHPCPAPSPWGCDRRLQLHRGVEQLQVHVLHLMAPAAPGVRHHRQAHHVASHIHVQRQLIREVGLHQGALRGLSGEREAGAVAQVLPALGCLSLLLPFPLPPEPPAVPTAPEASFKVSVATWPLGHKPKCSSLPQAHDALCCPLKECTTCARLVGISG